MSRIINRAWQISLYRSGVPGTVVFLMGSPSRHDALIRAFALVFDMCHAEPSRYGIYADWHLATHAVLEEAA